MKKKISDKRNFSKAKVTITSDVHEVFDRLNKKLDRIVRLLERKYKTKAKIRAMQEIVPARQPRRKTIERPIADFHLKGKAPKKYRLLSTLLVNALEKAEIYTPRGLFENYTQEKLLYKKLIGPGQLKEILIFANAFGVKIRKR